jgi:hypothetical protein
MSTIKRIRNIKRKADEDYDTDLMKEIAEVKRLKTLGVEIALTDKSPLINLLFHPSLTLEEFLNKASGLTSQDLDWKSVLDHVNPTGPEYPLFLERLQSFLKENSDCDTEKAVYILSQESNLTILDQWKLYVDLIELLLCSSEQPKRLLKAVRVVRDDTECKNQSFFNLLIRHIRIWDANLAEIEQGKVQGVWPGDGNMQEADKIDAESDKLLQPSEEDEEDELASECSSESDEENSLSDTFDFNPEQDIFDWLQERTEVSSQHRCPAGEARKDYEAWVNQSAFKTKRVSKQAFPRYVERYHPMIFEDGHRFFCGIVLKSVFVTSKKLFGSFRKTGVQQTSSFPCPPNVPRK